MDSLAANYASSDEDEADKDPTPRNINSVNPGPSKSLFSSLPPPKSDLPSPPSSSSSSSLFSSLPPPKSTSSPISNSDLPTTSRASSLFSSLPPPKIPSSSSASSIFSSLPPPKSVSEASKSKPAKPFPPNLPAKRVVQFTPPIHPSVFKSDDDDDEDEVDKRRSKAEENLSSKPLSSIIPAPKNSLVLGSASSGRRTLVEASVPVAKPEPSPQAAPQVDEGQTDTYDNRSYYANWAGASEVDGQWGSGEGEPIASTGLDPTYIGYDQSYGSYDNSWGYGTMEGAAASEASQVLENIGKIAGKRRRNEIPVNIMEVKQDELVKDRPREDQTKLTGIAFGPAYQPVSTQKGKPSKLHKKKHQIGSLYFDMKQKEMELSERRSKGMLTKRETQGKYGW